MKRLDPAEHRAALLTTAGKREVEVWRVAGEGEDVVVVIAGVHGSEQGGIEVVEYLIAGLSQTPRRSVVVIPVLFPDNAAARRREVPEHPTNRNFPPRGAGWSSGQDARGQPFMPENVALMSLLHQVRPTVIVSVHGTVRRRAAGVFSDAHTVGEGATDEERLAAGKRTERDRQLALAMALHVANMGFVDSVQGNHLDGEPTVVWSGGTPTGVSLGGWGPRPIRTGGPHDRDAIGVITVEVPENHRSTDRLGRERRQRRRELRAFRSAIADVIIEGEWPSSG